MSNNAHDRTPWTRGPWRTDLRPYDTVVVDGNGHPVASARDSHYGWESPNPEADARLIALAPEMAEAILQLDHGCDHFSSLCALCAVERKLRALSRPEGDTP